MRSASYIAILAGLLTLVGCGGPSARVTGRVTCNGNPVVGGIDFSPQGEGPSNTGPRASDQLKADGTFEVRLTTIGKHLVLVTPRDIKYPVPEGQFDYPCDRAPKAVEVVPGDNTIDIELTPRR